MENSEEFFLNKLKQLALKKNNGIKYYYLIDHVSSIRNLQEVINQLIAQGKVVEIDQFYFPSDFQPEFSAIEMKIMDFIKECLETPKPIQYSKVKGEFVFVNEQSFQQLLVKLQFQKKIIKLAPNLYIDSRRMEEIIEVIKKTETFMVKEMKEILNLSRETTIRILSYCDKLGLTKFDGTTREVSLVDE